MSLLIGYIKAQTWKFKPRTKFCEHLCSILLDFGVTKNKNCYLSWKLWNYYIMELRKPHHFPRAAKKVSDKAGWKWEVAFDMERSLQKDI